MQALYIQHEEVHIPFATMPNLRKLYLDINAIEQLDVGDLCHMPRLELLHLQYNLLTQETLATEAFKCLPILHTL